MVPLNHLLVIPAFTVMSFWYLSVMVVMTHNQSQVNHLLHSHIYFKTLLSNRYVNLFSRVIMLSLLISRILYLHISVKCQHCILHFIWWSERFCHLGWPQLMGFSHLLNPYCLIVSAEAFILLFIKMISWSWTILSMLWEGMFFCALYWIILDHALIFPSLNFS